MPALVNGVQHSYVSIRVTFMGRTLTGITKIDYDDNQEMVNNYGSGVMPDHRGYGQYKATISMELYGYEIRAMQKAAGVRLQQVPMFDVTVTMRATPSTPLETDVIKDVQIMGIKGGGSVGDTDLKYPVEMICGSIKWSGQIADFD